MILMQLRRKAIFVLLVLLPTLFSTLCESKIDEEWKYLSRFTNWSAHITQPSAFVAKAQVKLRKRPGGFKPGKICGRYVGGQYLKSIQDSRYNLCRAEGASTGTSLLDSKSSLDCYTAPFVRVGNSSKAAVSLCQSRNLLLDSCFFLEGQRKGTLSKKFPVPPKGAVRLACQLANITKIVEENSKFQWLNNVHNDVWWSNATRDDAAVRRACAPNSTTLVTTPTLFVMRDRHANYAHELEVLSMAFSFLAALDPKDVATEGIQVVIVDKAPATGFLETWARLSKPHQLRMLAEDPFPPDTCFRSAYHLYTFAAGIGYNTNPGTTRCESPVVTGLSNWLRQLYDESDLSTRSAPGLVSAASVAGPAAAAAGVRGLRPPAGGILLKNVVWLSRRNLEMVRLLLNASVGWKSMRLVRNEDEVVAGILAAVQEWNSESCLLRRFERTVLSEYERSLTAINPVHSGAALPPRNSSGEMAPVTPSLSDTASPKVASGAAGPDGRAEAAVAGSRRELRSPQGSALRTARRLSSTKGPEARAEAVALDTGAAGGGGEATDSTEEVGAGQDDEADEGKLGADDGEPADKGDTNDDGEGQDAAATGLRSGTGGADGDDNGTDGQDRAAEAAASARESYMIGNNIVALERLWEADEVADRGCRRTNVFFKFVDGDFNDMTYHEQLQTIFRTGVLVGVHGAGLTHGYFMQPGQSAVLQLLGSAYAKVAANNVFRNMAAGVGNYYEDVLYDGVNIDVAKLKQALKRSMDFVARKVMDAHLRRNGALRLVLVDQNHFSVVIPSRDQCPNGAAPESGK